MYCVSEQAVQVFNAQNQWVVCCLLFTFDLFSRHGYGFKSLQSPTNVYTISGLISLMSSLPLDNRRGYFKELLHVLDWLT